MGIRRITELAIMVDINDFIDKAIIPLKTTRS